MTPKSNRRGRKPRQINCKCDSSIASRYMTQCTICKTWQHSECIGQLTTNYRCEKCVLSGAVPSSPTPASNPPSTPKTSIDKEDLLKYIEEKSVDITAPFHLTSFFEKYHEEKSISVTSRTIQLNFRQKYSKDIHKMDEYDDDAKVRMLFATSTSIDDDVFLERLQTNATVSLDAYNRITKYDSPTLKLSGKHAGAGNKTPRQNSRKRLNSDDDVICINDGGPMPRPEPLVKREPIREDYDTPRYRRYENPMAVANYHRMPEDTRFQHRMAIESYQGNLYRHQQHYNNQVQLYNVPQVPYPYRNPAVMAPTVNGLTQLLSSIQGFFNAQTNFITEMTRNVSQQHSANSSVVSAPPSTVSDITVLSEPSISAYEFLRQLQKYLISIDNLQLSDINHQIVCQLQKPEILGKQITVERLRMILETIMDLAVEGIEQTPASSASRTTSTVDFLNMLLMFASGRPSFSEYCARLTQKIEELKETNDLSLPIDKIRLIMNAAISSVIN